MRFAAQKVSVPLGNVHPSKVVVTSTGVNPSFSSQEHRRPRFSFFNLHNVKELTLSLTRENVGEAIASYLIPTKQLPSRSPGTKATPVRKR
jgi:hypothetical protein